MHEACADSRARGEYFFLSTSRNSGVWKILARSARWALYERGRFTGAEKDLPLSPAPREAVPLVLDKNRASLSRAIRKQVVLSRLSRPQQRFYQANGVVGWKASKEDAINWRSLKVKRGKLETLTLLEMVHIIIKVLDSSS